VGGGTFWIAARWMGGGTLQAAAIRWMGGGIVWVATRWMDGWINISGGWKVGGGTFWIAARWMGGGMV